MSKLSDRDVPGADRAVVPEVLLGLVRLQEAMAAVLGPLVLHLELDAGPAALTEPLGITVPTGRADPALARLAQAAGKDGTASSRVGRALRLSATTGKSLGALAVRCAEPAGRARLAETLPAFAALAAQTVEQGLAQLRSDAALRYIRDRNRRLHEQARTDDLTGLRNAANFRCLTMARLRRPDMPVGLILVDLDGFKAVNDIYGHQFGNSYLRCVADAIAGSVPDGSLLGRIGGDEFALCVALDGDDPEEALRQRMADCSRAVMQGAAVFGKPGLGRVSMGGSLFPRQAQDYVTLFELADAALYASKRLRRGTCTVFDPAQHQRFDSQALDEGFDRALDEGRIVPWFQPIVDLQDGRTTHLEVLARWIDQQGCAHGPGDFAPVLTDHRMAERLTRRVVGEALAQRASGAVPHDVKLSVNLTPLDLANPEFVFDFCTMLRDHGQTWEAVVFEVTENTVMQSERDQVFRTLKELRVRGAQVALDDFGTGYGDLTHLIDWPLDILKIDRSFVAGIVDNRRNRAVVEAILGIARNAGFTVIAEGIETEEQSVILRSLGCRYGQGYLFSQPGAGIDTLWPEPDRARA